LVPVCWLILTRLSPFVPRKLEGEETSGEQVLKQLNPGHQPTFSERVVFLIFISTALAWMTHAPIDIGGWRVPLTGWEQHFTFGAKNAFIKDGTLAIAAAILLFCLPTQNPLRKQAVANEKKPRSADGGDRLLTWEFAAPRLPWGALLLFGGGLALAKSFDTSGLSLYLKAMFTSLGWMAPALLILVVIAAMTFISELASNTASAAMALPVLAQLAASLGVPPLPLMAAGAMGASSGYALPVATPPNTIAIATGAVTSRQMIRAGLLLDVAAILVMWALLTLLAPIVWG